MIESVETIKDVEKQLAEARGKLQAFEDGVDRKRLMKRLKMSSPAHPVLLFRGVFILLTVLMVLGALAVLVIPFVNSDLARRLAKFDALVPVPPDVPGLPALLGLLALCMAVGWLMSTMAALAMGRDAQMLPWEQKQHQKLVNEVTRLTTQKAVMERMRSTPAGARPRIETPVPVSLRDRGGMATPSALSRFGDSHSGGPPRLGDMRPGSFEGGGGQSGGNPFGRAPGSTPAPSPAASSGGGGGGGGGNLFKGAPGGSATPPGAPGAYSAPASGGGGGGVLARARSGALKTTPAGAAGRLAPNFNRGNSGLQPEEEGGDDGGPFAGSGGPQPAASPPQSSNPFVSRPPPAGQTSGAGGSPFGGASGGPAHGPGASGGSPFGGSSPFGTPPGGAQTPAEPPPEHGEPATNIFGTPPGISAVRPGAGLQAAPNTAAANPFGGPALEPEPEPEPDDGFPAIVDNSKPYSSEIGAAAAVDEDDEPATEAARSVKLPNWGPIEDPWLEESVERAEGLARTLPIQAHLLFSEETYLPFTLVLARATPTTAVRSLVAFVEFLSAIPTPPRARIELSSSPGLDRSFHRNVDASLTPIYGDDVEVDLEPGRVEITFKSPDASWQDYPVLPIA